MKNKEDLSHPIPLPPSSPPPTSGAERSPPGRFCWCRLQTTGMAAPRGRAGVAQPEPTCVVRPRQVVPMSASLVRIHTEDDEDLQRLLSVEPELSVRTLFESFYFLFLGSRTCGVCAYGGAASVFCLPTFMTGKILHRAGLRNVLMLYRTSSKWRD